MDMVTHNIQLDEDTAKALRDLAKKMGKKPEDLAADAVRGYVDYSQRLLADISAGERDIDEGRSYTIEEAQAELARRRAKRAR
jgi:predicted transcriptional regulator